MSPKKISATPNPIVISADDQAPVDGYLGFDWIEATTYQDIDNGQRIFIPGIRSEISFPNGDRFSFIMCDIKKTDDAA